MPTPGILRAPLLCLVTDRAALARALGAHGDRLSLLERQVAAAVEVGIDLVHLRERDLDAGALRDLAGRCAERTAGSSTRIVVNDRLDVALAAGAHGVHLRGDSYDAAVARTLAPPGFLLGLSVRTAVAAAAASDADYLVLGTVFQTPSKPHGHVIVGIDELARATAGSRVPVLAIGGVSEERLPEVARAGAAGLAAIRLFFGLAAGDVAAWRRRVGAWRQGWFDTNPPIS